MYFFNRCPQIPNASQVETGDCVIHQDAMNCGDFLNDYLQAEYYQKTYETGDLTNVKQYVQRFLTYPDGKEYANATDEVKMNATITMELMYPDNKLHWTLYVDPITSLVLTGLILYTTLGLLKVPMMILMQTVPPHIDPKKIESELIKLAKDEYETTINIHHLHVWTLSGDKIVGTVHIKLVDVGLDKFNKLVKDAKDIFHRNGIHHLTIQPEFATVRRDSFDPITDESEENSEQCLLICCDEANT